MRRKGIGLDYYSHDVKASDDRKIKLLMAKFGLIGYGFFFRICDMIYDENGYYISWTEEDEILFAAENQIDRDKCKQLLDYCLHYSLYCKHLFEKYGILTSRRIQSNFLAGCERRNELKLIKEYCLIDPEKEMNSKSKLKITWINVDINTDNVDIMYQKEKEREKEILNYIPQKKNSEADEKEISKQKKENKITEEGKLFADHFKSLLPKSQKVTDGLLTSWAETFDELIRIDGRDPPEIYQVTEWTRNDEFWSPNFLSANKLRSRNKDGSYYYDVFLTKMLSENGKYKQYDRYNAPDDTDYSATDYT